jgi:hypothetical protein
MTKSRENTNHVRLSKGRRSARKTALTALRRLERFATGYRELYLHAGQFDAIAEDARKAITFLAGRSR